MAARRSSTSRWPDWARHLQPRWSAKDSEHARIPTLQPHESPRVSETDSWESGATQFAVERRWPSSKRTWISSRRSAAITLALLLLQLVTMPGLLIASVYSLHCLFTERVYLSNCEASKNTTSLIPHPFLTIAMSYTLSVVEAAFILAILLGIAKSTDYAREAEHLESLQLGRIRRIVPLTRKFWTLLFLVAGAIASNLYTAFVQIRPLGERNNPSPFSNRIFIEEVKTQQWMYVAAVLEKVLLLAVMCFGNYTKPSPRAPRLTMLAFYLVMLFYAIENGLLFFGFSYHITFKVLPGNEKSIISMKPVNQYRYQDQDTVRKERTESMMILALLVMSAMCRASFSSFFFSKMFEPSKDLFHSVHNPIPLPAAGNGTGPHGVVVRSNRSHIPPPLSTIAE